MASNIDEASSLIVSTISSSDLQSNSEDHNIKDHRASCRRKLLLIVRLLHLLLCLAYNLYLVWLLAYLKENRNYWFLSLLIIPLTLMSTRLVFYPTVRESFVLPSYSVTLTLIICFTMLSRLAYYHRHPDDFIGPRFIILSLQGSIILILLGFFLARGCQTELLLKDKDVVSRAVLDFVDIFNMVEVLSANECGGLGSLLSEESSTEMAIQAFSTLSFYIVNSALYPIEGPGRILDGWSTTVRELHINLLSMLFQNVPFLIIRIVIWVRFNTYNLGFVVKNVTATVFCFANAFRLLQGLCRSED